MYSSGTVAAPEPVVYNGQLVPSRWRHCPSVPVSTHTPQFSLGHLFHICKSNTFAQFHTHTKSHCLDDVLSTWALMGFSNMVLLVCSLVFVFAFLYTNGLLEALVCHF